MRKLLVAFVILIMLVPSAYAGSRADPEIRDDPFDSDILTGQIVAPLEIRQAWVQPQGDDFHFIVELGDITDPPLNAVYVFHFSWGPARFYWRANWTADHSAFEYIGGVYQGCKPPACPSHDSLGNRNYAYFPGNSSLKDTLKGRIDTGSPGTIRWIYPMDNIAEDRRGLEFKGMFVTTYEKRSDGSLAYIDLAEGDNYIHEIYTPWWQELLPAPSPLTLLALLGVAGLLARRHGSSGPPQA